MSVSLPAEVVELVSVDARKHRQSLDDAFRADLTVPPTAVRIASGAQVSHFLHPGLAKTYAEARPSTS